MTPLPPIVRIIALAALLCALPGCSSDPKPAERGFLGDYTKLAPAAAAPGALAYRNPALAGRAFGRCTVDPVIVTYSSDSQRKSIDAQREADVKNYLAAKVEQGLTPRMTTGGDTLRVRVAVSDVDTARTAGSFQSTVGAGSSVPGRGTLEVELSDAKTGEVLLAFVDRRDNVRPSGPQQVAESKRQVDDAVTRLLAEFDAARAAR